MDLQTLETILLMLLVADALALGGLILLQHGKGADVGAAFGSGSANTMFGSAGSATFLTRLTSWLAIGFFLISFGLAYVAKEKAADLGDLGIPTLSAPADGALEDVDVPQELTPESQGVDSDIPDV